MSIKNSLAIVFVLIVMTYNCFGQAREPFSCVILEKIIQDKKIILLFHLDKRVISYTAFVDTNHYFSKCEINDMFGKEIRIFQDKDILPIEDSALLVLNIISVKQKDREIEVAIFCKSSKYYCEITLNKKRNQYIIEKFEWWDID